MTLPTKYDLHSSHTLAMLHEAAAEADGPLSAAIRHSARSYPEEPEMEAFMTLTEEGKRFAGAFGAALSKTMKPVPAASYITRCVETADLICRGFAMEHGLFAEPTSIVKEMTPFYMNNIPEAVRRQREVGHDTYLRLWLNGELPEEEILPPRRSADMLVSWLLGRLDRLKEGELGLGVTHDWNLFPVKEHFLGQAHEVAGQVGYLEGVVVYRRGGEAVLRAVSGNPRIFCCSECSS